MNEKNKKDSWFSELLSYADGSKGKLGLSVLLSVISVVGGLIPYFCFYKVIETFVNNEASADIILKWCIVAFVSYVVKVVLFGFSTNLSHHVAYHILESLRLKVADRFLHAPLGMVTSHSIGEIKNIIVEKIENIEPPLAHIIPEGAGYFIQPLVSLIALIIVDGRIALASLATVPVSFVLMMVTFKISGKNFDKYNESNAVMNSTIVEYIEGIEVIKAFGKSGASYEKYANAINNYRDFVLKWLSSTWATMKLTFALFPSTLLGALPVSLALAVNGSISVAQAALAVMLAMSMVSSLAKLEVFSENIREMQCTVNELHQYLEMPSLPEPSENADLKGYNIEIKNVGFAYSDAPDKEVLKNVSMDIPEGSFTALVGPSGSGKSTIAKLIARFYDVTNGSIKIGGTDVKNMPLSQLSDTVSFVAQDNFLFKCSILENIRMGNPKVTDEEVKAAARAAQCEEFIMKLPDGYNTHAGDAGKRLSGGEKQRIAIARMMLKNAPIVILDEATAFTDPENENKIQKSIAALTKGKTLLVIAHRLSTIQKADNIVILNNGSIYAQGTQEQLLSDCPMYQRMWQAHIGAKQWAVKGKEAAGNV